MSGIDASVLLRSWRPFAICRWLALLAGLCWLAPAQAQQCDIQALAPMTFGVYDPLSPAPTDAVSSFQVRCSPRVAYTAAISPGSAGTFFPRTLRQGINALAYNLFREPARITVWGDGSGGSQTVVVPDPGPPGNPNTVFIYGRVPAGQWVAAGPYADTLVLTIEF